MNDIYQIDDEAITLARGLSDEQRLSMIAKCIATGTPQGNRIGELIMAVHLFERQKSRDVVQWALGTLH
jgi:hypothetical protein